MGTSAIRIGAQPPLVMLVVDADAFRAWYEEVLPQVYRYLYARTGGDAALAEELTRRTMVDAVRARAASDAPTEPTGWLFAIARNRLIDHYRRAGRDARRQAELQAAYADPAEAAWHRSEQRAAVAEALDSLPPEQRAALVCRYLDGLSVADTAAALGRSVGAVESLLMRAKAAFRTVYRGAGDD